MAKSEDKKCKGCNMYTIAFIGLLFALIPVCKTWLAGDPLSYMYPNFLLFTGFRQEAIEAWKKVLKVNTAVKRHHTHIAEIEAEDYSYEALQFATDNWRHPAVVRGLFKDTKGVQMWTKPGYLSSKKLGEVRIPVVNNGKYGTLQNDRSVRVFGEAYEELLSNEESKMYIFFPVKSRFNFNESNPTSGHEELQELVNALTLEDLELHRIWNGFGTAVHKEYVGSQLIFGRGTNSSEETTGTGWHTAAGNNFFVQVAGRKRWYFMDPEYSALMSPLRGGMVNMMTGNKEMAKLHPHIPLRWADINAGDLLYNPDWEWHTIKNYEGMSIGCPIRELNLTLTFRNNLQYTSIVLINKLLDKIGAPSIGGYAPSN